MKNCYTVSVRDVGTGERRRSALLSDLNVAYDLFNACSPVEPGSPYVVELIQLLRTGFTVIDSSAEEM